MKLAYLTAGAAGMYCGTCMHDNTLATALIERGHEVSLLPAYTPMRTDERSVAVDHIAFGALNVYLQQRLGFFRKVRFLDRLLDSRRVLGWVSKLAGSASTDGAELGGLTLSMLQGERGYQAAELEKLIDFLEQIIEPEVVHLSHTLFIGFARRLRERLGVPVVSSLQGEDLFFDELEEPWRSRVIAEVRSRVGDVDLFTAPSRWYAETMAERLAIPPERIRIQRLGIASDDFRDARKTSDERPPTVGYLARICPEKGLARLIDAFLLLAEAMPTARLRVAGFLGEKDRAFFDEQRRRVDDAGLAARVDWVGEVDRAAKVDFLASCDVLSVPTVYREPKGLFVPEALASCVPVVQPDHGSFPEWIEATGGGLLVEPGDAAALARALGDLLADRERRHALGGAGREAVRTRFDPETLAREALAVYREALG